MIIDSDPNERPSDFRRVAGVAAGTIAAGVVYALEAAPIYFLSKHLTSGIFSPEPITVGLNVGMTVAIVMIGLANQGAVSKWIFFSGFRAGHGLNQVITGEN